MKIAIKDLKLMCEIILTHIESLGIKEIDINTDFYWKMSFEQYTNFTGTPPSVDLVGSLIEDDWYYLNKIKNSDELSPAIFVDRLGDVMRLAGGSLLHQTTKGPNSK